MLIVLYHENSSTKRYFEHNKVIIRQSSSFICFIQGKIKVGGVDCMANNHVINCTQTAYLASLPDGESKGKGTNSDDKLKLMFTAEQDNEFIKTFKIGTLKQLHNKELVTDRQLYQLIALQQ